MGRSVDGMTVASEASTRSLGSEQSSISWFEGAAPLPNKPPEVPPSPGVRSAEAKLEASTRAMESLLNSDALAHESSSSKPPTRPPPHSPAAPRAAVNCADSRDAPVA